MDYREKLIKRYFRMGFAFSEIEQILYHTHRIFVSERTLKRITSKLRLFRRKNKSDIGDVALFIEETLESCGQLHGYRWMYWKAVMAGFTVSQEDVRYLLTIQDPEGVYLRKRNRLRRRVYSNNGPNYVWHVDGYDKLKPFGIAIHGCIDGFSRHVLWLEAGITNNNPQVIAQYFLEAVETVGGCPVKVRADKGTENRYIEQLQIFMRRDHMDVFAAEKSFLYGSSNHNQRIEWFWGLLRKECIQFWIDVFHMLKYELDAFSGDFLDKGLVQFCFLQLIQEDLDNVQSVWDVHPLQYKKNSGGVVGKPFLLYNSPEMFCADDKLCSVDADDFDVCKEELGIIQNTHCDPNLEELCQIVMEENNWRMPECSAEAVQLYLNLRNSILTSL